MKNKSYRLIVKEIDGGQSFFIEQKLRFFFGLICFWDLLETGTNFKSELEAERFLKQLEVKRAKFSDKIYRSTVYYYDFTHDKLIHEDGSYKDKVS